MSDRSETLDILFPTPYVETACKRLAETRERLVAGFDVLKCQNGETPVISDAIKAMNDTLQGCVAEFLRRCAEINLNKKCLFMSVKEFYVVVSNHSIVRLLFNM